MPTLIDPQQIYPRRIGIYKGALVIQYYNLQQDCFKKHLIPYDMQQAPEKILENILKNPKHSVFLRKVPPHHLKSVISGKKVEVPVNINDRSHQSQQSNMSSAEFYSDHSSRQNYTYNGQSNFSSDSIGKSYQNDSSYPHQSNISKQNTDRWNSFKKKDVDESGSYNLSTSKLTNGNKKQKIKSQTSVFEDSHGYSMNFDQESMNISVVPIKEPEKNQHIVEQQIQYQDDFENFQDHDNQIKQKLKPKQQKVEKTKKQKQTNDFEFLDPQEQQKKKKKKKKNKSKQKDGKKKSKESSEATSKEVSIRDEIPIEQQFDFI